MKKRYIIHKSFLTVLSITLFFILLISGCEKAPVPEDTLVKVYADLVIARDTVAHASVSKNELDMKVFRKYNITRKDYVESIKSINKDPEQWEKFFDKVIAHLETLKKKTNKAVHARP
jgi:hypothetical protein